MIRSPTILTFAPYEWGTSMELRLGACAESPDACGGTRVDEPRHRAGDGHEVDYTVRDGPRRQ
jgi:hypothetical protein